MAVADPLAFLFSLERLGMKFGLDNMSRLCEALDHPERRFASVLVAGTNGKGSVTAMVEASLRAAGHRTARYTSPHLVRLEERFVMGGEEVRTGELREAAGRVQRAAESLVASGALDALPTFFECATAIAFELFSRAGVELAVLEVGLGGRLDATNIVSPVAAAIVSIDFDHQAQLGGTLESIAREKAGVARAGIPVVCGPLAPAADREIAARCEESGARMVRAVETVRLAVREAADATVVDLESARWRLPDLRLALRGRHQGRNAAVAVALLDELDRSGHHVTPDAVREGLSNTPWPGRLERFEHRGIDVLIDAAHNPAGARALADYLRQIGWTGVALVFGAMQDKDIRGILEPLVPLCRVVVCTTAATPRAMPAAALAELAERLSPGTAQVEVAADPAVALRVACDRAAATGGRVVIAGSIFLIGPLRDILR